MLDMCLLNPIWHILKAELDRAMPVIWSDKGGPEGWKDDPKSDMLDDGRQGELSYWSIFRVKN